MPRFPSPPPAHGELAFDATRRTFTYTVGDETVDVEVGTTMSAKPLVIYLLDKKNRQRLVYTNPALEQQRFVVMKQPKPPNHLLPEFEEMVPHDKLEVVKGDSGQGGTFRRVFAYGNIKPVRVFVDKHRPNEIQVIERADDGTVLYTSRRAVQRNLEEVTPSTPLGSVADLQSEIWFPKLPHADMVEQLNATHLDYFTWNDQPVDLYVNMYDAQRKQTLVLMTAHNDPTTILWPTTEAEAEARTASIKMRELRIVYPRDRQLPTLSGSGPRRYRGRLFYQHNAASDTWFVCFMNLAGYVYQGVEVFRAGDPPHLVSRIVHNGDTIFTAENYYEQFVKTRKRQQQLKPRAQAKKQARRDDSTLPSRKRARTEGVREEKGQEEEDFTTAPEQEEEQEEERTVDDWRDVNQLQAVMYGNYKITVHEIPTFDGDTDQLLTLEVDEATGEFVFDGQVGVHVFVADSAKSNDATVLMITDRENHNILYEFSDPLFAQAGIECVYSPREGPNPQQEPVLTPAPESELDIPDLVSDEFVQFVQDGGTIYDMLGEDFPSEQNANATIPSHDDEFILTDEQLEWLDSTFVEEGDDGEPVGVVDERTGEEKLVRPDTMIPRQKPDVAPTVTGPTHPLQAWKAFTLHDVLRSGRTWPQDLSNQIFATQGRIADGGEDVISDVSYADFGFMFRLDEVTATIPLPPIPASTLFHEWARWLDRRATTDARTTITVRFPVFNREIEGSHVDSLVRTGRSRFKDRLESKADEIDMQPSVEMIEQLVGGDSWSLCGYDTQAPPQGPYIDSWHVCYNVDRKEVLIVMQNNDHMQGAKMRLRLTVHGRLEVAIHDLRRPQQSKHFFLQQGKIDASYVSATDFHGTQFPHKIAFPLIALEAPADGTTGEQAVEQVVTAVRNDEEKLDILSNLLYRMQMRFIVGEHTQASPLLYSSENCRAFYQQHVLTRFNGAMRDGDTPESKALNRFPPEFSFQFLAFIAYMGHEDNMNPNDFAAWFTGSALVDALNEFADMIAYLTGPIQDPKTDGALEDSDASGFIDTKRADKMPEGYGGRKYTPPTPDELVPVSGDEQEDEDDDDQQDMEPGEESEDVLDFNKIAKWLANPLIQLFVSFMHDVYPDENNMHAMASLDQFKRAIVFKAVLQPNPGVIRSVLLEQRQDKTLSVESMRVLRKFIQLEIHPGVKDDEFGDVVGSHVDLYSRSWKVLDNLAGEMNRFRGSQLQKLTTQVGLSVMNRSMLNFLAMQVFTRIDDDKVKLDKELNKMRRICLLTRDKFTQTIFLIIYNLAREVHSYVPARSDLATIKYVFYQNYLYSLSEKMKYARTDAQRLFASFIASQVPRQTPGENGENPMTPVQMLYVFYITCLFMLNEIPNPPVVYSLAMIICMRRFTDRLARQVGVQDALNANYFQQTHLAANGYARLLAHKFMPGLLDRDDGAGLIASRLTIATFSEPQQILDKYVNGSVIQGLLQTLLIAAEVTTDPLVGNSSVIKKSFWRSMLDETLKDKNDAFYDYLVGDPTVSLRRKTKQAADDHVVTDADLLDDNATDVERKRRDNLNQRDVIDEWYDAAEAVMGEKWAKNRMKRSYRWMTLAQQYRFTKGFDYSAFLLHLYQFCPYIEGRNQVISITNPYAILAHRLQYTFEDLIRNRRLFQEKRVREYAWVIVSQLWHEVMVLPGETIKSTPELWRTFLGMLYKRILDRKSMVMHADDKFRSMILSQQVRRIPVLPDIIMETLNDFAAAENPDGAVRVDITDITFRWVYLYRRLILDRLQAYVMLKDRFPETMDVHPHWQLHEGDVEKVVRNAADQIIFGEDHPPHLKIDFDKQTHQFVITCKPEEAVYTLATFMFCSAPSFTRYMTIFNHIFVPMVTAEGNLTIYDTMNYILRHNSPAFGIVRDATLQGTPAYVHILDQQIGAALSVDHGTHETSLILSPEAQLLCQRYQFSQYFPIAHASYLNMGHPAYYIMEDDTRMDGDFVHVSKDSVKVQPFFYEVFEGPMTEQGEPLVELHMFSDHLNQFEYCVNPSTYYTFRYADSPSELTIHDTGETLELTGLLRLDISAGQRPRLCFQTKVPGLKVQSWEKCTYPTSRYIDMSVKIPTKNGGTEDVPFEVYLYTGQKRRSIVMQAEEILHRFTRWDPVIRQRYELNYDYETRVQLFNDQVQRVLNPDAADEAVQQEDVTQLVKLGMEAGQIMRQTTPAYFYGENMKAIRPARLNFLVQQRRLVIQRARFLKGYTHGKYFGANYQPGKNTAAPIYIMPGVRDEDEDVQQQQPPQKRQKRGEDDANESEGDGEQEWDG